MDNKQKIIIGSAVTIGAILVYAIYTDLSRLFPGKEDAGDKKKSP